MFDLQVLAFATEVTRVSAFKMGRDVSPRVFPESGVTTPVPLARRITAIGQRRSWSSRD